MSSALFQPIKVGRLSLSHRIVLAPLTRLRADADHVLGDIGVQYYSQRASTPGTLLITESTIIAPKAGGLPNMPSIYTDAQIQAWKKIVDAVHVKGSFIFLQLAALGRFAMASVLAAEDPSFEVVAPSAIPLSGENAHVPRALEVSEIEEYVRLYADAAEAAVTKAGFDGVEIHMGNGCLIDQFIQDVSNQRTDDYGGSVEKRAKFPLQVLKAVVEAVGESERVSFRVTPWNKVSDMGMKNPRPTFSHLVSEAAKMYPDLAYLHVVEPRISGGADQDPSEGDSNDFLRDIWGPRPFISSGGYTRQSAIGTADSMGNLVAFGRLFIANPDLPLRLKEDIPLTKPIRDLFYAPLEPKGYIDYPFATTTVGPVRA